MPTKLDCLSRVENILVISESNNFPEGFFSLPYSFFSLKTLKSKLKEDRVTYIDDNNFDIDIKIDAIICDSQSLAKNAYESSKNIGCRFYYLSKLDDKVNLPPDVIVVNLSNKNMNPNTPIIYPRDKYEEETPLSKKINGCWSLNRNLPQDILTENVGINECSIYLNFEQKVIDYEAIHAMGCATLVITVRNQFSERFLTPSLSIIVDNPKEIIGYAKHFLDKPEQSKLMRTMALSSYRERFKKDIFEKKWGILLDEG